MQNFYLVADRVLKKNSVLGVRYEKAESPVHYQGEHQVRGLPGNSLPAVRPKPGPAFQAGGIDRHSAGTIRSVLHGSCLYHGRIPVNKEVIREFSRESVGIDDHDIP